MEQQQQQLSSQPTSHQALLYTPNHPKIKPLLRRYYREIQVNETNYQKYLKTNSKTSRAVKTNTDKSRKSLPQYIRGYRKILTAQDSLKKLYYSFGNLLGFENAYLFSKIRGLRNLSSFEAQCYINSRIVPLKVLFKSLAYLKGLTHFKIELGYFGSTFNDIESLYVLFKSLRRLKKLENLSLCLPKCSGFTNASINNLPKYFSHLKKIHSLELSFGTETVLPDQMILNLVAVFSKLPLLEQISLDFGGQMRAIQASTIIQLFQNMIKFSEITLDLSYYYIWREESNLDPLSEGLRLFHAPLLKKLNLRLYRDLGTTNLIELSQTIKRFTSLERLNVNLSDCETLTNEGIAEFGLALGSLTMLSSFDLRVPHSIEADCIIGCIASALKSLQNLVNLNLNFANANTSLDQINKLSASLAKLNSLKFLNINFYSIPCFSDEVMQKFGEALLKLVQLKNLALDFSNAKTVTNQGVEALANAVQELQNLSSLGLNFIGNEKIDEKAVGKVAQILRRIPSLYSTYLRFSSCPKLHRNKKSFLNLLNALKEMKNIREVILSTYQNESYKQEFNELKKRKAVFVHW